MFRLGGGGGGKPVEIASEPEEPGRSNVKGEGDIITVGKLGATIVEAGGEGGAV